MRLRLPLMVTSLVRRTRRRGFTLLELIVAVGVLSFVVLGVASIFSAVGDTVRTGRRVSAINAYAARVEATMRRDLEGISRNGFLVIRHELANNGADPVDVAVFPGDQTPRQRRIDQIMFFSEGEFESARHEMAPGVNARGAAARIWYGHGMRAIEDLSDVADGTYLTPSLDKGVSDLADDFGADINDVRLGVPASSAGFENPNRYAQDWSLLRHVTVLSPPLGPLGRRLPETVFGLDRESDLDRLRDRKWQVALQPAALSVFRARTDDDVDADQDGFSDSFDSNATIRLEDAVYPAFKSGVVDVASETLAEIESVVNNATLPPAVVPDGFFLSTGAFDPSTLSPRIVMRLWMKDALPGDEELGTAERYRVRYEPTPPQLQIPDTQLDAGPDEQRRRQRAYREADQEMLTAHGFIPNCTEFIVEWSYGWTFADDSDADRYGRLQWFGLDRRPIGAPMTTPTAAEVFEPDRFARVRNDSGIVVNRDSTDITFGEGAWTGTAQQLADLVSPTAEESPGTIGFKRDTMFGYLDPDPNQDGMSDDAAAWPWPRLLRFTIRFADPNDPEIESSIRFVVEVRDRGRFD